jgi:hypothetical protein
VSETESEFKLRRFVRTVFESSAITDPESLAKEVLVQLDPKNERAALEQALRLVAQNYLTHARGSLTSLGGHMARDAHPPAVAEGRTTSTKSWKTAGSRQFWQKRLEELVHIEGENHQWIALGDCDVTALLSIAAHRDMLSTANAREAAGAREWAALLTQHNVTTVRKLPESVLRNRLQGDVAA